MITSILEGFAQFPVFAVTGILLMIGLGILAVVLQHLDDTRAQRRRNKRRKDRRKRNAISARIRLKNEARRARRIASEERARRRNARALWAFRAY